MNSILEKWCKGRDFKKWFRKDNLVILILTGVLLVIIALPTTDRGGTVNPPVEDGTPAESPPGDSGEVTVPPVSDDEYAGQLEQRLRDMLSQMEGVGQVRVMITLKSSQELVVEKEQPYLRSSTNENDAQGGNRAVIQTEIEENTVYRTSGNISEPYVIKTLPPRVEGVVVVAEGADSGTVNRTIVEMVQALFGVEPHKVKVVKMEMGR